MRAFYYISRPMGLQIITSDTTPASWGQFKLFNDSTARHAHQRWCSALGLQVSAADLAVLESLAQHCACSHYFHGPLETTCHKERLTLEHKLDQEGRRSQKRSRADVLLGPWKARSTAASQKQWPSARDCTTEQHLLHNDP